MKKQLNLIISMCITLVIVLSMTSCQGRGNKRVSSKVLQDTTYAIPPSDEMKYHHEPLVLKIEKEMIPLYDTLSTANLIESIKYIPLSSEPAAMIIRGGSYKKVADKYIVDYGNFLHRIYKIFNSEGQYECDAFDYGRGPNEISIAYGDVVDFNNNELIIFDSGKILYHNILTHKIRIRRIDKMDFYDSFLMDNGEYVVLLSDYDDNSYKEKSRPTLLFYDSIFSRCDTLFTVSPKHKVIEGVTVGQTLSNMLYGNNGMPLFKGMTNDTVYYVSTDRTLTPSFIIEIPKDLKPTLKESERQDDKKKANKIYLGSFVESRDYIFIFYMFENLNYKCIWSKKTGKLVYCHKHPIAANLASADFGGQMREFTLRYVDWDTNTFYTSFSVPELKHLFPDLKDDDNAILVEIKLKSE